MRGPYDQAIQGYSIECHVLLSALCLPVQWVDPVELHGVGQYAADAYYIFCRGDWRSVVPKDKDLLRYHQWLIETGGEGSGLMRDPMPGASGDCTPASDDKAERAREL